MWLRSFHHPVSIRLDISTNGTAVLTVKISNGAGGYEPGRLINNRTQRLGHDLTQRVLNRIEELKFWTLPTEPPPPDPNVFSVDGAQWIFEGVKSGAYHAVDRWSPDKGEVHSLGLLMLLDVAKLKLSDREVY